MCVTKILSPPSQIISSEYKEANFISNQPNFQYKPESQLQNVTSRSNPKKHWDKSKRNEHGPPVHLPSTNSPIRWAHEPRHNSRARPNMPATYGPTEIAGGVPAAGGLRVRARVRREQRRARAAGGSSAAVHGLRLCQLQPSRPHRYAGLPARQHHHPPPRGQQGRADAHVYRPGSAYRGYFQSRTGLQHFQGARVGEC